MVDLAHLVAARYELRAADWLVARDIVVDWLEQQCDLLLDGSDRMRVEVHQGRIKDPARAVDKLRRVAAEHGVDVTTSDQVELLVRDIVGVKALCKSTRDQDLLRAHLLGLGDAPGIRLVEVKDYAREPRPSGYRAVHVLLEVDLPPSDGAPVPPVPVELQIKTRVQDAWGELTHEDLYKPGASLRPSGFHRSVGRTMANLLAEVDRLADDLAQEFDLATEPSPAERPRQESGRIPTRSVTVRVTGPRYALAVDDDGNQGLIPAFHVRALAGTDTRVDVDSYVAEGDVVDARVFEDERGLYYLPVTLVERPAAEPTPDDRI